MGFVGLRPSHGVLPMDDDGDDAAQGSDPMIELGEDMQLPPDWDRCF